MAEVEDQSLVLAAEDCPADKFHLLHRFSEMDEKIILKLLAHGPVLLRGGRGCGKSALMIEASRRANKSESTLGVYLSLRHLELLKSRATEYEKSLCKIIWRALIENFSQFVTESGKPDSVTELQEILLSLSTHSGKRIILFFDDAAHIGREASLSEFFDIFRTISSNLVSCKAAIYPGVTRFGTRFDVFNDATVLDLTRNEELPGFRKWIADIMEVRFGSQLPQDLFRGELTRDDVGFFLGQAVLANMRAFVFACNYMADIADGKSIGIKELGEVLIHLASNHFWPLLEELKPKLGMYEPMVDPARSIAEQIFSGSARLGGRRSVIIHRDHVERLPKPVELLEYSGFIAKREASRVLKKGGRGPRYAVNLCNLLEKLPGRFSKEIYTQWNDERSSQIRLDPVEFNRNSELASIEAPTIYPDADLAILAEPIEKLRKSDAYPYGLTDIKIEVLRAANIITVRDFANASDEALLALDGVGQVMLRRFRNIAGQAIWM